jgi:hypothetical protein
LLSEAVKHEFFVNMQHALVMWLALIGLAAAGFGLMTLIARRGLSRKERAELRRQKKEARAARKERRRATAALALQRPGESAQLRELRRYAEEVTVAAERADVMAKRRHAEWVAVQRTQEAAWRAYEVAEETVRRMEQAAAFPTLTDEEPFDAAARRRHLEKAATAAHERGELSAAQLADALFHRNGWDPTLHPFEQDAVLKRVARDRLLSAYREAARIERTAWHAADMAAAARRSLGDEAFDAAQRVRRASSKSPSITAYSTLLPHLARGDVTVVTSGL